MGSIEIQVSWTKLTSSPIVVVVKDVFVIACPNTQVQDEDEAQPSQSGLVPILPSTLLASCCLTCILTTLADECSLSKTHLLKIHLPMRVEEEMREARREILRQGT